MEGMGISRPATEGSSAARGQESSSDVELRRQLRLHLERLPARYKVDMRGLGKADDDVLLHRNLLADCAHPANRPVVHARFLKALQCVDQNVDAGGPESSCRDHKQVLLHEIVFASVDKPKLLSQLSALMSDVEVNIREAHVYSTPDGFSLIIFLVDGWRQKEVDGLLKTLKDTIARRDASLPSASTTALGRSLVRGAESLSLSCTKG